MARTLDVYLHNDLAGQLVQDDGGQMLFDYAESWLNRPGATPLSQSLPLRKERFSRNECRGFFGGILPEESKARNHRPQSRHQRAQRLRHAGADRRRVRRRRHFHSGRRKAARTALRLPSALSGTNLPRS